MKRDSPFYCIYCGQKSTSYEVWAGPPPGMKGDYGTLTCAGCGYEIVFKSQDIASLKTLRSRI